MTAQAPDRQVPVDDRPALITPTDLQQPAALHAQRLRIARQPGLGWAGMLLVLPIAVLFAVGAGGAERSVLVLGPLITFALPAVVMVAFWWDDWPGTNLRPSWSGWFDTLLVAVLAVLLTIAGQAVVGRVDVPTIFDPYPPPDHLATFPALMPLAGAGFTVMLQLTLVTEGWPLRRLPAIPAGIIALVLAWVIAAALYVLLVDFRPPPGTGLAGRPGPLPGATFGAVLTLVGVWQVWFFLAWRGWPFSSITRRWVRLVSGNIVTIGGGILSYLAIDAATSLEPATITAGAGALIAAGLTVALLFEGVVRGRGTVLAVSVVLAVGLYALFTLIADQLTWTRAEPVEWVAHVGLNAWSVSVILHVAVGRRWPFGTRTARSEGRTA